MVKQVALKSFLLLFALATGGCAPSPLSTRAASGDAIKPAVVSEDVAGSWSQSNSLDDNLLFQDEQHNDVESAVQLLKNGSNPNLNLVDTNKVIDFAAEDGHVAFVRLLIHFMPQLTRRAAQAYLQQAKNVALDSAVTSGTPTEVNALLTDGAGVNNLDGNDRGGIGSPLMRATARGSVALVRLLLRRGAAINERDLSGRTALMYVTGLDMYQSDYNEVLDGSMPADRLTQQSANLLLQHGADIGARDHSGKTALMWASQGNPQVVSLLLARRAKVNAQDKSGRTALLCAASVRDSTSMARLLAAGADVNAQDKEGETPLMRASVQPDPSNAATTALRYRAVMLLLRHGAAPRLKDKQQRTAGDYAKLSDDHFISAS